MYEDEVITPIDTPIIVAWAAVISNTVTAAGQDLFVKIPQIDNGRSAWGPCRWNPQVNDAGAATYPAAETSALVVKDSDGEYWVLQWWTYG
jgi:hypothetical protein